MTAPPPIQNRSRSLGLMALVLLALTARRAEGPESVAHAADTDQGISSESGRFFSTIKADGHLWSYVVQVPTRVDDGQPLPVILALHGSSGSGQGFLDDAGWADLADLEGVIVVAPDGLPMRPRSEPSRAINPRLWNSGQHPSDRPRSQVDDLAFFDALLAEVSGKWPVDPNRIYAVGHSNGGAMALRLGAERSEVFAAVASVSALRYVDPPEGARAVPILAIFGGADPLLPTEGGLSILPWEIRRTPEIMPEVRRWAEGLGCPPSLVDFRHEGTVHSFTFPEGHDGATLAIMLLDGHGHVWPGGPAQPAEPLLLGPRTDAIHATPVIWRFLADHPRHPSLASEVPPPPAF